jgi:hypothetical protein
MALGEGNWFEVLATSPAEPGLASILPIPTGATRDLVLSELQKPAATRWRGLIYRPGVLSAGGWADLHPVPVLKASGCGRVVYLTRKGGDAVFGQQIFVRLLGQESKVPFWRDLAKKNDEGWKVDGNSGNAWNRLYNFANPDSSFNQSIRAADAVYCTDWNRFNPVTGELSALTKEAYGASVFLKPGAPRSLQVNAPRKSPDYRRLPGCVARPKPKAEAAVGGDAPGGRDAR